MGAPAKLLLCTSLVALASFCEAQQSVTLPGFVTRVASPSDFDVNAIRIFCGAKTRTIEHLKHTSIRQGCPEHAPYVGEVIEVHGDFHSQDRSLAAKWIEITYRAGEKISGSAVIDAMPSYDAALPPAADLLVRADGYRILITSETNVVWVAPMHALADVQSGDWINYRGVMHNDGTIVAEDARFARLTVTTKEGKFRTKSDYDPSQVPDSAHQNGFHQVFIGIDYKHIPPYNDPKLQTQITAIGESLIPGFQRNLPHDDPAKISFRFQLTDDPKWRDVAPLPSGIILIPYEAVQRMQNDAQLAELLADGIACAIERSQYRMHGRLQKTAIGAFLVVNPLIATGVAEGARSAANSKEQEQSGRVSLGLLHDAGYDIDQAPVAWWLLAPKEPKPTNEVPLPDRAANLYRVLGEVWNNPAAAELQKH